MRVKRQNSPVFQESKVFKPFKYQWAYDLWLTHEKMHWSVREVILHEDIRHYHNRLEERDRIFLTNNFLLFTQGDIDVSEGYVKDYLPHFSRTEIRMMLLGFAAREAVHIDAYAYFIETIGKSDSFYQEFREIPVMRAKHEFFRKIVNSSKKRKDLPVQMAGISAFTEGMFLFSTFIMLLTYPRSGLMPGMGQVVSWSILDEQVHVEGLMKLFDTVVDENPEMWNTHTQAEIIATAEFMTELELDYIDYAYGSEKEFRGLHIDDLKQYIKFVVDRRLIRMGLKGVWGVKRNPIPWVDEIINSQNHENFFETRAVSYGKGSHTGSFADVWGKYPAEK